VRFHSTASKRENTKGYKKVVKWKVNSTGTVT